MQFLEQNSLWLVLLIAMLGWAGIFLYLRKLDGKIRRLERQQS